MTTFDWAICIIDRYVSYQTYTEGVVLCVYNDVTECSEFPVSKDIEQGIALGERLYDKFEPMAEYD